MINEENTYITLEIHEEKRMKRDRHTVIATDSSQEVNISSLQCICSILFSASTNWWKVFYEYFDDGNGWVAKACFFA